MTSSTERPTSIRHRGAAVAIGLAVANVATYIYTVLAARLLGPQSYGALASLMAVLLVISVIQLGIQTTAARRISADPEHVGQIEREILALTYRAAAVVGVFLLILTPLLDRLLRLDSLPAAALVAVSAVPLTIVGGQLGHPAGRAAVVAGRDRLRRLRSPPPGHRHGADGVASHGADGDARCHARCGGAGPARGVRAAPPARTRQDQRAPRDTSDHPRDPHELSGAAGLPRPDELRRDRRPQHPRGARRRSLRGRAHPDQGHVVPPPVRGGGGVPGHVHGPRAPRRPAPQPDARARTRLLRRARLCLAAPARADLRRRSGVRRDRRPPVAVRRPRHGAVAAPAAHLRRARPPGHPIGLARVGRAGHVCWPSARSSNPRLPAARRGRRRHRAVPDAARDQPASPPSPVTGDEPPPGSP